METPNEEQPQTFVYDAVNINVPDNLQIAGGTENQNLKRRMERVPTVLRKDKNCRQDYDPLVVSLGLNCRNNWKFQSVEYFKLIALRTFVAGSGQNEEYFYFQVRKHVGYARNCYVYSPGHSSTDSDFARQLLLDACFIINIILQFLGSLDNYHITRNHLGDINSSIAFRDLFILENQIPFRILKHLMCLRYGKQEGQKMLNEFLTLSVFGERKREIVSRSDPLHLVEACWLLLVGESSNSKDKPTPQCPQPISSNGSQSGCLKHMGNSVKFSHLVKHISNLPCFPWRKEKDNGKGMKKFIPCFRSATDLKAKGIYFRPSTTNSLRNIKFNAGCFYAQLEVPTCFVAYYTKVKFLNILAYELGPSDITDPSSPNAITNPVVLSYIEFMKLLISNSKDVKELREKKKLLTTLASDEEVVKVYKEINTYGVSNFSIFHDVKEEIQAHYDDKPKNWLAELIYTYFRSPWTALALFAATFLLVLTFLQTYYTVRPSKFPALNEKCKLLVK